MQIRNHPKIAWSPDHAGPVDKTAESPQSISQSVIREVHQPKDKNIWLSSEFKGKTFKYCLTVQDAAFAKKLAAELAKYIGRTLEQLVEVDIDF